MSRNFTHVEKEMMLNPNTRNLWLLGFHLHLLLYPELALPLPLLE